MPVFTALLFSCSTSNEVVRSRMFQKRKYTKGYFVNSSLHHKKWVADRCDNRTNNFTNTPKIYENVKQICERDDDLLKIQASTDNNFVPVVDKKKFIINKNIIKQENTLIVNTNPKRTLNKHNKIQTISNPTDDPKPDKQGYSTMAILGFIISFIALPSIFLYLYLPIILGLSGAFISLLGLLRTVIKNDKKGKFFAIMGIILGLGVVFIIFVLIALASAFSSITI